MNDDPKTKALREEFEVEIIKRSPLAPDLRRHSDGIYRNKAVDGAWRGYQWGRAK